MTSVSYGSPVLVQCANSVLISVLQHQYLVVKITPLSFLNWRGESSVVATNTVVYQSFLFLEFANKQP